MCTYTKTVVASYDVTNKLVVIQCDASQSGLGPALLQQEHPVAFRSHLIIQTEQHYAQIGKNLITIV